MNTSICKIVRTVLIAGSLFFVLGYTPITSAAQGCGYGWHRGAYGGCVHNHPGPYARPANCWRNAWGQVRCR